MLNVKKTVLAAAMPWAFNSLALMLAVSFIPGMSFAQSPTTLKDAVERAILQNPEVKLRFHNLNAAQQERKAGQGAWLPRIDLETATGRSSYLSPGVDNSNYDNPRSSIQVRQTLFDGFATLSDTRRLSYSQQAAYFDLLSASNQTGLEAARTYLDVLRYRELVTLAADNFTTHQEVHDRISQKVAAGVGRRVDLEQASGRMALAESNWLTEVSNAHDVSARYQRLIGDLPADSLARLEPLKELSTNEADFLADATRKNPDFQGAVANIRAYRADAQLRRAALYPTVELRARQSVETNQSGVMGDYRSSGVEVVLNYNLYRGGSDLNRAKQYAAKLEAAYDLRDKACRDIWQTGQIAINDSKRLTAQLKLLSQHELSTSKARQAYQQQFDIGQRSLLDLLDTENELYQARRSLTNGEYDLQLAKLRVLASSGELLSSMQLQPLSSNQPDASGGQEADDGLLQCNNSIVPALTLNRAFDSRPVILPPVPATPVAKAASVVEVPPAAVVPPVETTPAKCVKLPEVVQSWLSAWNNKDFTKYLASYADNFVPALGMSRNDWESLRKKRITKQGSIVAILGAIKPVQCDAKTAEVSFTQEYSSVDYKDHVEKTLSLVQNNGVWKITRETVTKGRTF